MALRYQHGPVLWAGDGSDLFTLNGGTLTFIPGIHGDLTITTTTPETSTVVLLGLGALFCVGAALSFGRKERKQAVV
jgi:hypothetical protein